MTSHSILVVDDDPLSRDLLKEVFSRKKYVLFSAASAAEALGILAGHEVDVVVSNENIIER